MTVLNFQATSQQVAALFNELKASGTQITENGNQVWVLSGHGMTADVSYSNPSLTVTVVSKPFFITANEIRNAILEALQNSLADIQMKAQEKQI